jgi:hypothetical protein
MVPLQCEPGYPKIFRLLLGLAAVPRELETDFEVSARTSSSIESQMAKFRIERDDTIGMRHVRDH